MLKRILTLVLLTMALAAPSWSAPPVKRIQGVWLSPDWILPGTRTYDEASVRAICHDTVAALKKENINTIFMETLVRGSSIASGDGLPIYPHLKWAFARRGTRTLDALQILIDEADGVGIAVHAWVHMFYWRMDNDDVFKSWQRCPSIWDDLLVAYLQAQADRLHQMRKQASLERAVRQMALSVQHGGVDGRELSAIMLAAGYETDGHPLGSLIHDLMADGCPAPDFLLIGSADDPFPRTPNRSLRPIYINGANPKVRARILQAVTSISNSHPDLAGIHLDHIRFPTDGQGIPSALDAHGRDPVYFDPSIPEMAARYKAFADLVSARRSTLTELVNDIRARIYREQQLSAAVLPLYYVERSDGTERFNGYDYSAQDWHTWNVDFVVPMMYGFDPWRIRTLVRRFDDEARAMATDRPAPLVIPGISRLAMGQNGLLGDDDYVYFDLSLGLDIHYEREHDEDYNWSPRKDL